MIIIAQLCLAFDSDAEITPAQGLEKFRAACVPFDGEFPLS